MWTCRHSQAAPVERATRYRRPAVASSLLTFGVKPPPRGAPRVESLRFIRDIELRSLLFVVPAFLLLVLVSTSIWWTVIAGVAIVGLVQSAVRLTLRIRREPGS
jgi:hypothetical protein